MVSLFFIWVFVGNGTRKADTGANKCLGCFLLLSVLNY